VGDGAPAAGGSAPAPPPTVLVMGTAPHKSGNKRKERGGSADEMGQMARERQGRPP